MINIRTVTATETVRGLVEDLKDIYKYDRIFYSTDWRFKIPDPNNIKSFEIFIEK